jgi:DNA repair exonuclease SbcCD ATPase subunit
VHPPPIRPSSLPSPPPPPHPTHPSPAKHDALRDKFHAEVATSRRLQNELGILQRDSKRLTSENESLSRSLRDADQAKSRLSDLARKLQEVNKQLSDENKGMRDEEAAKRAEHAARVQATIDGVQTSLTAMGENASAVGAANDALRAENEALRAKAGAVADALAKVEAKFAAELEVRSLEVKMAQAQQARAEALLKESTAHIGRLESAVEGAARRDEEVKAKFEGIQTSLAQYAQTMKMMEGRVKEGNKHIALLEETKGLLERAKLGTETALVRALADKQKLEADLGASTQQTAKALSLCKVLQAERKMLLDKVAKGEGGGEGPAAAAAAEGTGSGEVVAAAAASAAAAPADAPAAASAAAPADAPDVEASSAPA